jgi:TRAP-type mannitol/chloroaromatic compound transport system permease small subunit
MQQLLGISRAIDRMSEWLGKVATVLVLLMATVGIYNVFARFIGRYIGVNLSSNVFIELQWYLFSLVFLLGFPYVLKRNENVRVDFFYANFPPRRQAFFNLLGTFLFLFPFCILAIWVTITPVLNSWQVREMSPDPSGLPRYPLKTMIIVSFVLLFIQGISEAIKYVAFLRDVPVEMPAEHPEVEEYLQDTKRIIEEEHISITKPGAVQE